MKKKGWMILFIFVVLSQINWVYADLLETSQTPSFNVYEDMINLYNITIRNTNNPPGVNFTQINVTFPSSFTLITASAGTDAPATLITNGQTLSWTNNNQMINSSEKKYFWVNANSTTAGTYYISVTSLDTSSNTNSSSVQVTVNYPISISFISPTPGDDSTLNYSSIYVRVSVSSLSATDTVEIFLYNSSHRLIDSEKSSSSQFSKNFTSLTDGVYYINATANNSIGSTANTTTRKITISNSPACDVNWSCTGWSQCINTTQNRTCNDLNYCNITTLKPAENQFCCAVAWDCTQWTPEKCPKDQIQTRTCIDLNSCNDDTEKPQENTTCEYQSSLNWLFYVILGGLIVGIIIVAIFIILTYLKNQEVEN